MADTDIVWPVGTTDQDLELTSRPLVFNPKGFLVAILEDADQAEQARTTLAEAGFAERDLRVYTPEQILDSWERFQAERSLAQRAVGAVTDDQETLDLDHGHARDGRFALWVRVADDEEADRAIRGLAGCATLHIRHYGHRRQSDFYLQRPTS